MVSSSSGWKFEHYICPGGKCPIYEFLRDLRDSAYKAWWVFEYQRKVQLEKHGPMAGPPYWARVGGGLGEIKWNGPQHGNLRIYASAESDRRIVMYIGRDKRWRTFTNKDRKICEQCRVDFRSSDYDAESRELRRCAYYQEREAS